MMLHDQREGLSGRWPRGRGATPGRAEAAAGEGLLLLALVLLALLLSHVVLLSLATGRTIATPCQSTKPMWRRVALDKPRSVPTGCQLSTMEDTVDGASPPACERLTVIEA